MGKYRLESRLASGKIAGEGEEEEHLDLFIRSTLQTWLANIVIPPEIRGRILRRIEIDTPTLLYMRSFRMYQNEGDLLYRIQKEHHKDLMREAEESRLIQMARGKNVSRSPLYAQLLLWLGRRMMALGYSLFKRYGTVSGEYPAPTLPIGK